MQRRPSADEVSSEQRAADDIWKAVKMMLPGGTEGKVLCILMKQISQWLVEEPERTRVLQPPAPSSLKPLSDGSGIRRAGSTAEASRGYHVPKGILRGASLPKRLATLPRVGFTAAKNAGPASKPDKRATLLHGQRSATWTNAPEAPRGRTPTGNSSANVNNVAMPIVLRGIGRPKYKCPHCPQIMALKAVMQSHITGHGAVGKFSCDECDFATDVKRSLTWHAKAHLQPSGPEPME